MYSQEVGKKYARHRCKHKAFASMESSFGGEFNHDTVVAIMAAKAKYIEEHIEEIAKLAATCNLSRDDVIDMINFGLEEQI